MNEKIALLNIDNLNEIENRLRNASNWKEESELIYDFCCNPVFVNSLYYLDKYDEITKTRIENLSICFNKLRVKGIYTSRTKNFFRISLEELVKRLKNINTAYETINSNNSDYSKAFTLATLFKDSETLKNLYSVILKDIDHPNLQIAREALYNFEQIYNKYIEYEKNGMMNNVEYVVRTIDYHQNYEYAKFVIEKYIEDENSYKGAEFLEELGLDKESFVFCVKTIQELDPDLFKKFAIKSNYNKKEICLKNIQTIIELANGIKTKQMSDGTSFNILEFIKRVPFKKEDDLVEAIIKFGKMNNLKEYKTIIKYINANELNDKKALTPLNQKRMCGSTKKINGVLITKEVNDTIIDYLKVNQIPIVNKTYNVALDMYLNGKINKDEIDLKKQEMDTNKKQSLILIPNTKKIK